MGFLLGYNPIKFLLELLVFLLLLLCVLPVILNLVKILVIKDNGKGFVLFAEYVMAMLNV